MHNDEAIEISIPEPTFSVAGASQANKPGTQPENSKMWASSGEAFYACEKSVKHLPAGQYTIKSSHDRGIYFSKTKTTVDELLRLPDSASDEVIDSISDFWTLEDKFRELGFLWKRGILLYGPPGSGKTSTLQLISQDIVKAGGLAIYVTDPNRDAEGLEMLRRIEPNRQIVVLLEDIDAIIYHSGEASMLALLDGELQIDNVVFIATTNYPEKLDKRFVNRPSRFDIVKKVGMPNAAARRLFLSTKNDRLVNNQTELDSWVKETTGFSIAHLKELIISVECFGIAASEAITRLRSMMDIPISSDEYGKENKSEFGFVAKTEK